MPTPFRGFIAVDLRASDLLRSFMNELRTSGARLKIVDPAQIHLTLKFLGDTEEGLAPEIAAGLREVTRGIAPFELRLRGTGAFPSLGRINVLWIGAEGAEPLARIAIALDRRLEPLGFAREARPWSAHVTVARTKGGGNLDRVRQVLRAHEEEEFGRNMVDAVCLKKSVLTPKGPLYSDVERVDLVP